MPIFRPGQGLNSIRWRFATAGAVLTWAALLAFAVVTEVPLGEPGRAWWAAGRDPRMPH
jgi:hypothetical protein